MYEVVELACALPLHFYVTLALAAMALCIVGSSRFCCPARPLPPAPPNRRTSPRLAAKKD